MAPLHEAPVLAPGVRRPGPPGPPALFKGVLLLGTLALGLWGFRLAGLIGPPGESSWLGSRAGTLRSPDHEGHDHARAPALPEPLFGEQTLVPHYGNLPDFSLIEADESPVDLARLRGRVWVATFVFTRCSASCPAMAERNRILQRTLPEGSLLVSFSVDPQRDTPAALRDYGFLHQRDASRWLLVTGPWKAIQALAQKGFYLSASQPGEHSQRFVLVDQQGGIRGFYEYDDEAQMTKLVRDVNLVLAEAL